jgi:hypothetical protein
MQFNSCPRVLGQRSGCHLTTLFGTESVPTVAATDAPVAAEKHGWLPLLTVLFLISYGLMTMLIVEQGRTIESQRALIRELFRDSKELSAVRMKAAQEVAESNSAKSQAPVPEQALTQQPSTQPSAQAPANHYPSTQYPSTQAPTKQAPSSQAGPQPRAQNQSANQKPDFRMPSKPALELVDDVRVLITI